MKNIPVCLKLVTGDELFGEIGPSSEENGKIRVYYPHIVHVEDTNLFIRQWSMFSDDKFSDINVQHVLTVNLLDSLHLKMYGSVVLKETIKTVQKKLYDVSKVNVDLKNKVDDIVAESIVDMYDLQLKYGIEVPSFDLIKDQYYTFLLQSIDYESGVTQ